MNKIIPIMVLLCLILAFCGCKKSKNPPSKNPAGKGKVLGDPAKVAKARKSFGLFKRALEDNNLELAHKYILQCADLLPNNGAMIFNLAFTIQKVDPGSNRAYVLYQEAIKLGLPEGKTAQCRELIQDIKYKADSHKKKLLKPSEWESRKEKYSSSTVEKADSFYEFVCSGLMTNGYLVYIHIKTGLEFVLIPAGRFEMGSPSSEKDRSSSEGPVHTVTLKAFLIGKTEVTQGVWKKIMGSNPSNWKGDDLPVEEVSWTSAKAFCKKTGLQLPTEAQWEYACRAGTTTRFYWGEDSSSSEISRYSWYSGNSGSKTHSVAQKKPNAFGLYDMSGNVWEWVEDNWHGNYTSAPNDGRAWYNPSVSDRVSRGGCWDNYSGLCRSACRGRGSPGRRYSLLGFRLARPFAGD